MNSQTTSFSGLVTRSSNIEELMELQGQCRIQRFQPLRRNWFKTLILAPLLVLCSALILLGVMRKRRDVSAWLMYDKCVIGNATHVLIIGNDRSMEIVRHTSPYFFYRKVKYFSKGLLPCPVAYCVGDTEYFNGIEQYKEFGLNSDQIRARQQVYGLCEHTVDIPTLSSYLADEMMGIFFILQYITCVIYVLEGFISFGAALIGTSLISTIINYFLLRSSYQKIKELAEHKTVVQVVREKMLIEVDSTQLVPGDIFIPTGVIPCDCLLVDGQLYLNEASLTGESVPIAKSPAIDIASAKYPNCWLYEGSNVVESRGKPLALAINTGFVTRKGRIFRKILFRQHVQPEFYWYAFYFLLQMFAYCTIIYLGMIPLYLGKEVSSKLMILRFFDMMGWAIPPSFPIAFNVCYSLSLYRLRKQNIFGTEPYKTIVSGKVTVACFDKTGTLTKNQMELNSIVKFLGSSATFIPSATKLPSSDLLSKLMASCHTVRRVEGQFVGDELDLRMFLHSEFTYTVPNDDNKVKLRLTKDSQILQVLRINQFESQFQAMSVLIHDVASDKYYIFVKGAPEKIQRVSNNKVADFDKLLSDVSLAGLRCLGVGFREVEKPDQWAIVNRSQFEKNLHMLGLVTFDNRLKDDTIETIKRLVNAQIEVKVITGDNIYIAVQTAIRTNILHAEEEILVLQGSNQDSKFTSIYLGEVLSRHENKIVSKIVSISTEQLLSQSIYAVAIDNAFLKEFNMIPRNTKIFARITPESKALVVKMIKDTKARSRKAKSRCERLFGRTLDKVAMIGDGANDIMAIKEADLGIGISDTDSSFAANFSVNQLLSVQYIFREGKATLSIIIDSFRYYGGISVLKFLANSILIYDRSSFNDNQFTYLNYFSTIEIMFFICFSRPGPILSRYIPNDNLMGLENRLIFIGNVLIPTAALIVIEIVLVNSSLYIPNTGVAITQWSFQCQSNTALFLSSHLFYIWNVVWIYTYQPWKEPMYKNITLMVWLAAIITVNSVLFFFTDKLIPFFDMTAFPLQFESILFGITYGTLLCGLFWRLIVGAFKLHIHD